MSGTTCGKTSSAPPSGTATMLLSKPAKPLGTGSSPIQIASDPSEPANGQQSMSRAIGIRCSYLSGGFAERTLNEIGGGGFEPTIMKASVVGGELVVSIAPILTTSGGGFSVEN